MIILLHGSDSYRRSKRLSYWIDVFKEKYPTAQIENFALGPIEKKEFALQEFLRFREFCGTISMFADKKLAVLEGLWDTDSKRGKKSDESAKERDYLALSKAFRDFLKAQLDKKDAIILINSEKAPPANFAFIKGKAVTIEKINELDKEELKSYIKNRAKELGAHIDEASINFLINFFQSDLWAIITEIERLRWFYPLGKSISIDMNVLKKAGDYFEAEDIFSFINSLIYPSNLGKKLSIWQNLLLNREEPVKVFNIMQSLNYLSPQLLERLADYDIMVKSGKMEYDDVLLDLIIN